MRREKKKLWIGFHYRIRYNAKTIDTDPNSYLLAHTQRWWPYTVTLKFFWITTRHHSFHFIFFLSIEIARIFSRLRHLSISSHSTANSQGADQPPKVISWIKHSYAFKWATPWSTLIHSKHSMAQHFRNRTKVIYKPQWMNAEARASNVWVKLDEIEFFVLLLLFFFHSIFVVIFGVIHSIPFVSFWMSQMWFSVAAAAAVDEGNFGGNLCAVPWWYITRCAMTH